MVVTEGGPRESATILCVAPEKPHRRKPDRNEYAEDSPDSQAGGCDTLRGPLSHQKALHWSLWRILVQLRGRKGAKVTDVLDAAEAHGIDRFWACETLMSWIDRGDIAKSHASNRVVPQRGEWMP